MSRDIVSIKDLVTTLLSPEFKAFLPEVLKNWSSDPAIKPHLSKILMVWSQEPEVQEFLLLNFNMNCATSELQLLKRHSFVEDSIEELQAENKELKAKVVELENKLKPASERVPQGIISEVPTTITDIRADYLIDYIESDPDIPEIDSGYEDVKYRYINNSLFKRFVKTVLPEKYRPITYNNLRKLKKDVFENAVLRHKDKATIDQAYYGNKETRLIIVKDIPLQEVT